MNHITLKLERSAPTAVEPTRRVCEVAAMFGLGVDERRTLSIIPPIALPLRAGSVVFITGASGGGKTTLLRLIADACGERDDVRVIDFADLQQADDQPLVESLGQTLDQAVRYLSLAGLNDAFAMLRKPGELSDGQRYRFRLARAMEQAERCEGDGLTVLLADEFAATLDRTTAAVIARNVRKWVDRCDGNLCFVAATSHDDLLEAMSPDVLVVPEPGGGVVWETRSPKSETRK